MAVRSSVQVRGKKLSFHHGGDGPFRIFFIHGLGGNADLWQKQCAVLENDFECVAFDLFNHGHSEKGISAGQVVSETALTLIDFSKNHLPKKPTVLISHSWGGCIVAEILKHHLDWKAHIGIDSLCIHDDQTVQSYRAFSKSLLESADKKKAVEEWFSEMIGATASKETKALAFSAMEQCGLEELIAMTGAIEKHEKLNVIPRTVLFESSQYFSDAPNYSWLSLYPEAKKFFEPGTNHFFFLEQAESFNLKLKSTLEDLSVAGADHEL